MKLSFLTLTAVLSLAGCKDKRSVFTPEQVFYINKDKSVINISNYDSIDVEVDCQPVEGAWTKNAKKTGFGFRLYTPEATGFWSGFEDLEYFGYSGEGNAGTIKKNIKISPEWVEKLKVTWTGEWQSLRGEAESVRKFILVVVTGVASSYWEPNGQGNDINGFNAFGGELRNDILPYMRANYNVAEG